MTEMDAEARALTYETFTVRMAIQLLPLRTHGRLPLSPALSPCAPPRCFSETVSISLAIALLAICILMQSAVNTFNDYYDFVKGADSLDDDVEEYDATLVYNNGEPPRRTQPRPWFSCRGIRPGRLCHILRRLDSAGHRRYRRIFRRGVLRRKNAHIVSTPRRGGKRCCHGGSYSACLLPDSLPGISTSPFCYGPCLRSSASDLSCWTTNNTCDREKDIESGRRTLPCLIWGETAH